MVGLDEPRPAGPRWTVRRSFGQVVLLALLLAWIGAAPARALDPELSIAQYKHTQWTAADGVPANILALAQGADGYLWVGGTAGLHRFDGVAFEHIPAPEFDSRGRVVTALLAARDGSLWAGYDSGHFAHLRGGALHDASADAPTAYVMKLVQTADGVVWAVLGRPTEPLLRYDHGRWQAVGAAWGLGEDWPIDAMVDSDGALWLSTLQSIFVLRPGVQRFARVGEPFGHAAFSQHPDGSVWISDDRGSRPLAAVRARAVFATPPAPRLHRAILDRDGNVWTVNGFGLARGRQHQSTSPVAPAVVVELFGAREGLSGDTTAQILEDREGNIWVSSTLGLDRFRAANVIVEPRLNAMPAYGFEILGASDGAVYIGARDAVYRATPDRALTPIIQAQDVQAMCGGANASLWIFEVDRVHYVREGHVTTQAAPRTPIGIHNCAEDRDQTLWANAQRGGLFSRANGRDWSLRSATSDSYVEAMVLDRDSRLVLLRNSGQLQRLNARPGARALFASNGSPVSVLHRGHNAIYVGGPFGLARVDDNGVRTLGIRRFPWLREPTGIVQTPQGQTWMLSSAGIVGLDTAALERAFVDESVALRPTILSFADGLPNIQYRRGEREAALGGDGRVWFALIGHVVWIDPERLVRNPLPPPVAVQSLSTRSQTYRDPSQIELQAGVSSVAIRYTALSLSIPERVAFRYRLEGLDREWVEAGSRREVQFSNLGPGTYRFQVIAANHDGVWNTEGATLTFTIPPTFMQSIWFKFIVLFCVCALVALAYALRVQQVTAQLQNRFNIRVAERERIARELHDTLLQGFHGLLLRFQSITNRVPAGEELRASLDDALDRADAVLTEGRARVRDLRAKTVEGDLAKAIVEDAHKAIEGDAPRFRLTVEGSPRTLHALVSEEVTRIAEEAIRNVVQHANAKSIEAILSYGGAELRLTIRDDGVGMPQSLLTTGEKVGHFGLIGMRERAVRIGGHLEVASRETVGTEITLSIPQRAAYKDQRARLFDWISPLWPRRSE
jgi:signal transduction histidine kinase/ligand-binding sensor domain-containing protein